MSRDDARVRESRVQPTRNSRSSASLTNAPSIPGSGQDADPDRKKINRAKYVIGLNGDVITLADLPSPRTKRWVIRRKAEVVLAVHGGLLSLDDACKRYALTVEEFLAWHDAIERHGLLGLRSTQLQQYRHSE